MILIIIFKLHLHKIYKNSIFFLRFLKILFVKKAIKYLIFKTFLKQENRLTETA